MTFREDMEKRGFDLPETQELFRCILSAQKNGISEEQEKWLLSKRRRVELFLEVVNA